MAGSFIVIIALIFSILSNSSIATAASAKVQQPPSPITSTKPDIVITSFGGSGLLDFVEIYNQSPEPINLSGSQIKFSVHDTSDACADHIYSIDAPDGWLLSKSYFTFERGSNNSDDTEAFYTVPAGFLSGCETPALTEVDITGANGVDIQKINLSPADLNADNWAQHKQRGKSSINLTGVFSSDYGLQPSNSESLYSAPLYQPPTDVAGLQILEILPHAFSCPPTDKSLLCSAYVKLFNASKAPINLDDYRLRTSYGGLKSSTSNTTDLEGVLLPGQYKVVNSRDDGSPLGLTQSGGYVWLEDIQGVQIYQPVTMYPDASTDSKIGQAWAFDGSNWHWTASPQPMGPNIFTLAMLSKSSRAESFLKPCAPDQIRSPITNRCRKIASSTKAVAVCKPGQQRNLATGRCRSVASSSNTRKPCKAGQERNPDTGRCRKIQPKIKGVKDIRTAAKTSRNQWYIIVAVAVATGAYIIYEWQQELGSALEKMKAKLFDRFRLPGRQKV
ncbi:MAG TPA: hypothetical protein VHA05_00680 [Candidatus Saccharimonadales bacterium]|nr:hypothetical protein [Candidatus Saccharimonadales bacterium]